MRTFDGQVRAYLGRFRARGMAVSVFLTSDELYMAPTDWIGLTKVMMMIVIINMI